MQGRPKAILSFDTSNYTTSVAVTDDEQNILIDKRKVLKVKQGERGLRQSDALFQHLENLPVLLKETFSEIDCRQICAVAVSDRPRPVEGSYMPVFQAGVSFGKGIASVLSVPFLQFSHQEGHITAAARNTDLDLNDELLAFHLSGGTCELLLVSLPQRKIEKLGGTKDISFGQLIDRLGVTMGLSFPAGAEMDRFVSDFILKKSVLKPIPFDGLSINLSGIETQALRLVQKSETDSDKVCASVFIEISKCLSLWSKYAASETGHNKILFSGGVSASKYIRKELSLELVATGIMPLFGDEELSSDNAVGIALLGGNTIWQ
jgi:N6-L-threonylcarbamoyladenine synthase